MIKLILLRWSGFVLLALGLAVVFGRCRPSPDFETLERQILDLHQQTIDAHWKKDAGFLARHMADDYFAVQNGEIRKPTREEITAEYERYLGTTTFKEYRDLRQPVVGFSKDGSIAWSIVQVKVAGRDLDESGEEKDFDLTWAWITLYERRKDRWIWLGEASNFKPNPKEGGIE
jgi:hypothetical protein